MRQKDFPGQGNQKTFTKGQVKVQGCPTSSLGSNWPSALDNLENPAQKKQNCHHWAQLDELLWTFMCQHLTGGPFVTSRKFTNTVSPSHVCRQVQNPVW